MRENDMNQEQAEKIIQLLEKLTRILSGVAFHVGFDVVSAEGKDIAEIREEYIDYLKRRAQPKGFRIREAESPSEEESGSLARALQEFSLKRPVLVHPVSQPQILELRPSENPSKLPQAQCCEQHRE
jgi:hypothetical protein